MAHIDGEIVIAAPAEQVFDTVADERNEPRYNPRIIWARKTSQGPVGHGTWCTAEPRGMGGRGVMTVQVEDYDRPRLLATSVRSSYMAADGTLTFAPADAGGTRMRWSWDMRLRGAMRVLSPLIGVIGPRWEYRNWRGLKEYTESAIRQCLAHLAGGHRNRRPGHGVSAVGRLLGAQVLGWDGVDKRIDGFDSSSGCAEIRCRRWRLPSGRRALYR